MTLERHPKYSGDCIPVSGVPFVQVFASDNDDENTPNAQLSYSIERQIPNTAEQMFFTINQQSGEISTTQEGK